MAEIFSPSIVPAAPRFREQRIGSFTWTVRDSWPREVFRSVLENPDRHLAVEDLQFKSSPVVTVVRVPTSSPHQWLVLRRLNYGKLKHRLRDFLRPSRALRALHHGLALEQIGIPTPSAFAAAETRCCRWPLAAYLITAEISRAQTLDAFLCANRGLPRLALTRLADLLARLHNHGYSHRDLKATNLLLDDQLQPWLIDLDGLRRYQPLREAWATADLVRFARGLSRHSRLFRFSGIRFLIRYCQQRDTPHDPRRLTATIARRWG